MPHRRGFFTRTGVSTSNGGSKSPVPMDGPVVVGVLKCPGDLPSNRHRFIDGKLLIPIDSVSERFPLHAGHHVIEERVSLT